MKKLITLLLVGLFTLSFQAQKVKDQEKTKTASEYTIEANPNIGVFEFESETIDYGTIQQNADGVRSFKFKNIGKSPIIITRAKGSCGCTVPTVPKKPIMPGESAEIGVKYDTKRTGAFSKSISITSNASEKSKVIRIKGKVLKADATEKSLQKPKSIMSVKE